MSGLGTAYFSRTFGSFQPPSFSLRKHSLQKHLSSKYLRGWNLPESFSENSVQQRTHVRVCFDSFVVAVPVVLDLARALAIFVLSPYAAHQHRVPGGPRQAS